MHFWQGTRFESIHRYITIFIQHFFAYVYTIILSTSYCVICSAKQFFKINFLNSYLASGSIRSFQWLSCWSRTYVYWSCQGNAPSLQTKYRVKRIRMSSTSFVWLYPGGGAMSCKCWISGQFSCMWIIASTRRDHMSLVLANILCKTQHAFTQVIATCVEDTPNLPQRHCHLNAKIPKAYSTVILAHDKRQLKMRTDFVKGSPFYPLSLYRRIMCSCSWNAASVMMTCGVLKSFTHGKSLSKGRSSLPARNSFPKAELRNTAKSLFFPAELTSIQMNL